MPPTPTSPMPTKLAIIATRCGRMPLSAASSGLSAEARIALPMRVKASAANTASMMRERERHGLELLRAEADVAEAHVARDRPVVAAHVVAEAEPHDVLQHQPGGDRGDRRRQRALLDQRQVRHAIEEQPDRARDGEGDRERAHDLQARAIGDVAREGAERRDARDREVRESAARRTSR